MRTPPSTLRRRAVWLTASTFALCSVAGAGVAGTSSAPLSVDASTREAYVNEPFAVTIRAFSLPAGTSMKLVRTDQSGNTVKIAVSVPRDHILDVDQKLGFGSYSYFLKYRGQKNEVSGATQTAVDVVPRWNTSFPVVGETVSLTATLPPGTDGGRAGRKVALFAGPQIGQTSKVLTTTSSDNGGFSFEFAARADWALMWVTVPSPGGGSQAFPLRTLRPQTRWATALAPSQIAPGNAFTVVSTVLPARPGTAIELQQYLPDTDSWSSLGQAPADEQGQATFNLTAPQAESTMTLRTFAAATDSGVPEAISEPTDVVVSSGPPDPGPSTSPTPTYAPTPTATVTVTVTSAARSAR